MNNVMLVMAFLVSAAVIIAVIVLDGDPAVAVMTAGAATAVMARCPYEARS